MKIRITFDKYPAGGKFMKCGPYANQYWVVGPDKKERRLPKFIWDRL